MPAWLRTTHMLLANLNAGLAGASPRLLSKYSAAADVFLRVSDMLVVLGAAMMFTFTILLRGSRGL